MVSSYGKGGDGFFLWKRWRWFLFMARVEMVSSYGKGGDGFFYFKDSPSYVKLICINHKEDYSST